jgi:TM2 domain-containing membrane protein YozV
MSEAPRAGLSADTQALMAFETGKKSMGVAYLLWFFLGAFGGHRFYTGRTGSAIAILLLWILGWCTVVVGIGFLMLGIVGIWVLVDAFLIPSWIRSHNMLLMAKLSGGASPMFVAATS